MKRMLIVAVLGCCTVTSCGGSASTSTTTPSTPPSTAAVTTTDVSVPFANVTTPTTVALSRDARLATERCRDALGQFFASQVGPLGGGHKQLKAAEDLCDEAELQLKADNPAAASVAKQLLEAVMGVGLSMRFADLKVLSDQFDTEAEKTLQDAVDIFDAKVDELLKS